jgi:non-canonical (house-cleaning) NTP pyrophosphatase
MALVVAVGTKSALKVRAVESALKYLEGRGIERLGDLPLSPHELRTGETDSGIPAQPFGLEQMFTGALNRARAAREAHDAHIGIGIENGLVNISPEDGRQCWFDPPAVAIVYPRWQVIGLSLGAALPIPYNMVREVQEQQSELGVIVQKHAGGGEKDPHKFLSKGMLDRESIIVQAILSAFTVIINADEYRVFNPNE